MKPQEKKYLVHSFDAILKILTEKGAKKIQEIVSTHFYGQHEGNDVEKFVEYTDRFEIHVLKEHDGLFTMTEHKSIANRAEGLTWLTSKGYKIANIVKMEYVEYAYQNGTVGLYTIDDFLLSVILYYPCDQLDNLEKEFSLQTADIMTVPYNKYLMTIHRLRSIKL